MKVWLVVQHYDKGSDEFCVEGVFDSKQKAWAHVQKFFVKFGWEPIVEEGDEETPPEDRVYYSSPGDENSDEVYIVEDEVQ